MTGIEAIATYVPDHRESNFDFLEQFELEESFITEKIGVLKRAVKNDDEDTSTMAFRALENLLEQTGLAREEIDALVVVTQNPDTVLPHVSALVHGLARLRPNCAAFDLSLGCSGYVYGLSILQSFLNSNGLSKGVLITCDPYSKIVDKTDKATALLFGDAAAATLLGSDPILTCEEYVFGTQGDLTGALVCQNGKLQMNGREVFNFAATIVPKNIETLLLKAEIKKDMVDCFIFHQGSRFIVETLRKRLDIDKGKVRIGIENIGNTVSSSIPILLEQELANSSASTIVLCGFGVGLSWGSCICRRVRK